MTARPPLYGRPFLHQLVVAVDRLPYARGFAVIDPPARDGDAYRLAGLQARRRPVLFSVRSSALGLATIVRPIIAIAAETLQSRSPFDKR